MPTYKYRVRDKHGRAVSGLMGGASEKEVVENLKKMGYAPIEIKEQKPQKDILNIALFNRVKDEDKVIFTRQIHTLLNAGVPLLTGLEAVSDQSAPGMLKDTISKIKADVEAGTSFSDALSKYPKVFSSLYVNMVKSGEASGKLDEVVKSLAEMGEYDIEIKSKIKAATRYPMLALGTLVVAFFVIVLFIVPKFAYFFSSFDMELPLPTRMLLALYRIVHDYWYFTLAGAVVLIVGFIKLINTPFGKPKWDMLKLKVPVFGPLLSKLCMSRFAKTTSILITSGIDMLTTLDLTAEIVGNVVLARAIRDIKDAVNQGKGLAEPMRVSKLFAPIVVQMVAIGEESGKLDELLLKTSEYYDQQVDYAMKNLTTLIEPILIFALGFMVLFVALGVFLPMWNMVQIVNH